MVKPDKFLKKPVQHICKNWWTWIPNTNKIATKSGRVDKFVDNKNRNNKENNKSHKKKSDISNNKRNTSTKKIQ